MSLRCSYNFRVVSDTTGSTYKTSGFICEEDWEAFLQFEKFSSRMFVELDKHFDELSVTYEFRNANHHLPGILYKSSLEGNLSSILHPLRPFVLKGEGCYFPKIVDRLQKYVYKEGVSKKPLGVFKECYSGNYMRRNLSAVYGDVYTDFNKLWKDWSNSEEYHPTSTEERHSKQKKMLSRFSRSLPRNLFVPTMHFLTIDKCKSIHGFGMLISEVKNSEGRLVDLTDLEERIVLHSLCLTRTPVQ